MRQVLGCFTDVLKNHWGYVLETILVAENQKERRRIKHTESSLH